MSARRLVVLCLAFALLLAAAPALAYSKIANDGNDSRSPLDISRVTRTDNAAKMRFEITTFGTFAASRLDIDKKRYFWIGFDRDRRQGDTTRFELCVFVFFEGRLRWVATNCGNTFIAQGFASHPTARKLVVPISMVALDIYQLTHEWAALSSWKGSPCLSRCLDAVPNTLPLFLRDFTPPKIVFAPPRLVTTTSTSASFPVSFSVSDPRGSGIAEWDLHAMSVGFGGWTVPASGTSGGDQSVPFDGTEGMTYDFYVTATDEQGNYTEGPLRRVIVPHDDDTAPGRIVSGTVTTQEDPTAYGGSLSVLSDTASSYSFFAGSPQSCPTIWLIGPGSGDWEIRITWNVTEEVTISNLDIVDGPRKVLWKTQSCGFSYTVKLIEGTSVAIDAIGDAVE